MGLSSNGFVTISRIVQMRWNWHILKYQTNLIRYGLSLAAGELVLAGDPQAMSRKILHSRSNRWQTIGRAVGVVVLYIEHSDPKTPKAPGHIFVVRKATAHERQAYEDGAF